jgi:hypothetical protein
MQKTHILVVGMICGQNSRQILCEKKNSIRSPRTINELILINQLESHLHPLIPNLARSLPNQHFRPKNFLHRPVPSAQKRDPPTVATQGLGMSTGPS